MLKQFIIKSRFYTLGLAPFCHSRNLLAGIQLWIPDIPLKQNSGMTYLVKPHCLQRDYFMELNIRYEYEEMMRISALFVSL